MNDDLTPYDKIQAALYIGATGNAFPDLLSAYFLFNENKDTFSQEEKDELLFSFSRANFYEGVKACLEVGANPLYEEGTSLIKNALKYNNIQTLDYLLNFTKVNLFTEHDPKHSGYLEEDLHLTHYFASYAASRSAPDMIDFLASKGLNFTLNDNHPLCWACSHGNIKTAEHLIKNYPVDINAYNSIAKETPLSWAVLSGNIDSIKLLLKHNVNIDKHALKHIAKSYNIDKLNLLIPTMELKDYQFISKLLSKNKETFVPLEQLLFLEHFNDLKSKIKLKRKLDNSLKNKISHTKPKI